MSATRTSPRLASVCLLLVSLAACGDDGAKEDPSTRVSIAALSTESTRLEGPSGTALVIPAGASDEDVEIVLTTPRTRREGPASTVVVGPAVRLEPEGKTFLAPLQITIPITPSSLPAGKTIDDVIVVRAPQGTGNDAFVPLPTRREGNAVVAETEHFSDFLAIVVEDAQSPFGSCTDDVCAPNESCEGCPHDCGVCLPSNDSTAPTVSAVEQPPANTGVRGDAFFAVRFDEALLETSVVGGAITLVDAATNAVAGAATLNGSLVVFTPSVPLLPNASYTLSLSGIRDLAGNVQLTPYTETFTTGAGVAYSVQEPMNAAIDVGQYANIDLSFSGPVALGTLTAQVLDGPCTGSVQLSVDDFTSCYGLVLDLTGGDTYLGINPIAPYTSLASVKVRFASSARDANGFSLTSLPGYGFTGELDDVAPTLASIDPANNTMGVDRNAPIILTFSEPVNPTSIHGGTVWLEQDGQGAAVTRTVVGNVVTLTPTAPLLLQTYYSVRVQNVLDLSNNSSTNMIMTTMFQTAGSPHANAVYPLYGEVGIHPRADLELSLSAPANTGTLTMQATDSATCSGSVQLSDGTICYGGTLVINSATSITIRATTSLPYLATMTVRVMSSALGATGLPFNGQVASSFRVSPSDFYAYQLRTLVVPSGDLGGVAGADTSCLGVGLGSWKALLITSGRYPCTTTLCGTGDASPVDDSADWVLHVDRPYVRMNGDLLFTTDSVARIPAFPGTLATALSYGQGPAFYFGGTWDWLAPGAGGACNDFTDGTSASSSTIGDDTSTSAASTGGWLSGGTTLCNAGAEIVCVQQVPGVEPPTH